MFCFWLKSVTHIGQKAKLSGAFLKRLMSGGKIQFRATSLISFCRFKYKPRSQGPEMSRRLWQRSDTNLRIFGSRAVSSGVKCCRQCTAACPEDCTLAKHSDNTSKGSQHCQLWHCTHTPIMLLSLSARGWSFSSRVDHPGAFSESKLPYQSTPEGDQALD